MSKENRKLHVQGINLDLVSESLYSVEASWPYINDQLDVLGVGRKDEFSYIVRDNLVLAYAYLDLLIRDRMAPFSKESIDQMLELNHIVHYGHDEELRFEYREAKQATADRFYEHIEPIAAWYKKHEAKNDNSIKLAAEIYVAILGKPQLYDEGNHRTGNLIANWIDAYSGLGIFVLNSANAVSYFAPAAEIKYFTDKSTWRGRMKLPKYRKKFGEFWQNNIDERYLK